LNLEDRLKGMSLAQAAVIGFALVGFYWAIIYNDGKAIQAQISSVEVQIRNNIKEKMEIENSIVEAKKFSIEVDQWGEKMKKIFEYVPEKLNTLDLMKVVSNEAKASGTNIVNIESRGSIKDDDKAYEEISVTVGLTGSYSQLLLFLSNLTKVDKIITLKEISIASSGGNIKGYKNLNFKGILSGYRYVGLSGRGK